MSEPKGLSISYLGHETFLFGLDGVRLLTDPVLRMRFEILRRHAPSPDPQVVREVDAVLISHLHLDHVNPTSLRMIPKTTPVLVPPGARAILRRYHLADVRELAPGQSVHLDGVTVTATPALHTGKRYPWGRFAEAVGYTIQGSQKIYFAGDTGYFDGLADLAGDLDVALLPIWGWGLRLPDDHLSPETAAQALRLLRPRLAIPMHWGTFLPLGVFRFYAHNLTDPPAAFVQYARELAPETRTVVIRPGDTIVVPGSEDRQGEHR
jgi:L-ascorbate metabolism protein UlaG (beta-lactamase superfamily)